MSEREAERVIREAAKSSQALYAKRATTTLANDVRAHAAGVPTLDEARMKRLEERQAEAERVERAAACFAAAKVPDLFRSASLADLSRVPEDVRDAYSDTVTKLSPAFDHPGLYALAGEIGAGKTHMACALVNRFCKAGRSARYVKAADYVEGLRATWKSNQSDAETRYKRPFETVKLLVIDEWQVRRGTDDENLHLLRLVDRRYESGTATVIVSNHANKQEFMQSIDARVADRMCAGGGFIPCHWESLRGRLKEPTDGQGH